MSRKVSILPAAGYFMMHTPELLYITIYGWYFALGLHDQYILGRVTNYYMEVFVTFSESQYIPNQVLILPTYKY